MKVLALDFDGVVSESAREAFTVALQALRDVEPGSSIADLDQEKAYRRFVEMMPLGNRAEDFGTALLAIERGLRFETQEEYDRFRARRDEDWVRRYHHRFYQVRSDLAENDPATWLSRMRPYRPLPEILRRNAGTVDYAIATAKDRRSVRRLLRAYGMDDLFPEERVLDKESGTSKRSHLTMLESRLRTGFREITFVDDKVRHLETVAPLGVRCVLAAWGYNGPREHARARELGFLVLGLDRFEETLFGAPRREA